MAALQCEFCGGKLITKAGGICECDSCGMEFDKTWVKEKIQEIKGTVKVEGTVAVQGTVKIDGPIQVEGSVSKENLLERGNLALADGHWNDAEGFFDRVLNLEPHNAQAYLGKYMAWMKAKDFETLKKHYEESDEETVSHSFLKRAKEFADPVLGDQLAAMETLRQSKQPTRKSLYSKVKNRIYFNHNIVAAKTLDNTLLIDGRYDEITFDASYRNSTHNLTPFSDEWHDVDKIFGEWEYASTCPGGQEVVDHMEYGSCIFAVDHTGNVYAVDTSPDFNKKLQGIIRRWKDVDVILIQGSNVLAKTHFGTAYWASASGERQKNQQKVKDWKNIIHIALNEIGAFGLSKEGRVFCLPIDSWDTKEAAEKIAAETDCWSDIQQIIVGKYFIAGLTAHGDVKLAGTCGNYEKTFDVVESVASQWIGVRHLDSANDLTCIFEDGTACNVHDGELLGDWSAAKKLYHDENGYYGVGEGGSVCVGWKTPLPDGILKEEGQCRLHSNGTLTGKKTKKKVLDFVGDFAEDDWGMVLYEDGTVEVFEAPPTQAPEMKIVGWKKYNTSDWKLFKSRATFDQEYQQGLKQKQAARESYEKELAQKLVEIEKERLRQEKERALQEEKQRSDEYEKACALLAEKQFETNLTEALSIFEKLKDYRDSAEKIPLCQVALAELREQERLRRKQIQYQKACEDMKRNKISVLQTAICNFKDLGDWEDSDDRILLCNKKIETLKRRDSLHSQKKNLEKELGELGLFARKRKKEIAVQIESIEKEIDRINKEELN